MLFLLLRLVDFFLLFPLTRINVFFGYLLCFFFSVVLSINLFVERIVLLLNKNVHVVVLLLLFMMLSFLILFFLLKLLVKEYAISLMANNFLKFILIVLNKPMSNIKLILLLPSTSISLEKQSPLNFLNLFFNKV